MTVTLTARSRSLLAGMFWGVVSDALERGLPRQVDRFAAGDDPFHDLRHSRQQAEFSDVEQRTC